MSKEIKTINKHCLSAVLMILIPALAVPGPFMAAGQESFSAQDSSDRYFKIQVLYRQTGRGVPLGAFCHSSKSSICVSFARYSLAFSGLFQAS